MTGRQLRAVLVSGKYTKLTMNEGTGALVDVDGRKVITLNHTGIFLVNAVEETGAEAEALAERLTEAFEVDKETARKDVDAFLTELSRVLEQQ